MLDFEQDAGNDGVSLAYNGWYILTRVGAEKRLLIFLSQLPLTFTRASTRIYQDFDPQLNLHHCFPPPRGFQDNTAKGGVRRIAVGMGDWRKLLICGKKAPVPFFVLAKN